MTHTPGPWTVVDQVSADGSCTTLVKGGDHVVCKSSARPKARQKQDADAKLIAAAPDLLQCAMTLDDAFCICYETEFEQDEAIRVALNKLRSAIAKATGDAK